MTERRISKLERLVVDGPRTDRWFIRPGSRNRAWIWFSADEVSCLDELEAYFELERVRGRWRVVRQVEAPPKIKAPDLDLTKPWPRAPRTLGEIRRAPRAHLNVRCECGARLLQSAAVCRAFDTWTVEEAQRMGLWRCADNHHQSVEVYALYAGARTRVELWKTGDALGWVL